MQTLPEWVHPNLFPPQSEVHPRFSGPDGTGSGPIRAPRSPGPLSREQAFRGAIRLKLAGGPWRARQCPWRQPRVLELCPAPVAIARSLSRS